MQITNHHRFERSLAEVWAMFLDPAAHVGKYAEMGQRDIEIVEVVEGDDELSISIVRVVDGEVPSVAKRFIKPSNTVTTTDRWKREADGVCRGTSQMAISNVPLTVNAAATLEPAGVDSCTYTIDLDVALRVPVVGDRILRALRPQLRSQMDVEFEACERWLARSPS